MDNNLFIQYQTVATNTRDDNFLQRYTKTKDVFKDCKQLGIT